MGEKQLSGVMDIIKREAALKTGQPIDEAKLEFGRKMLEEQIAANRTVTSPPPDCGMTESSIRAIRAR